MARSRKNPNPVTGGVRRRRTRAPNMKGGEAGTIVEYSAIGATVTTSGTGLANHKRVFIGGSPYDLTNTVGPSICSYYSTCKFIPGTKIRWEPSVSFTTPGRVYVGFTDNPETMTNIQSAATQADWNNLVKGLGDVISFPVWQETEINFPTKLRRKMFDTNSAVSFVDVNALDRSAQIGMFVAVDGAPVTTSVGSFWYHDKVLVEGIQPTLT